MEEITMPANWRVSPERVEFLGLDDSGRQYWSIDSDVFRHDAGFTVWVSKLTPFNALGRKRYRVRGSVAA